MPTDPKIGKTVRRLQEDPSGPPGRTRGNVPASQSLPREAKDKTAGCPEGMHPVHKDPTAEAWSALGPEG